MSSAVVGAARVVFGADTSNFDAAAKGVEGVLGRLVERFREVEERLKRIGVGVTLGLTVPFAALTRAADKTAGGFEAQMKRVEAALDNVTGEQLEELSDQARKLGPAVGKSATEAATGIEELGLAGLSTAEILGGGLKATLDLAAAGMSDVGPAAGLVTDVMGQFKKTAAELPAVVGQVVGAMDASKFGFEDFQLAVAQGGGIAAEAGVSFMDFATAVAATSTQFSSGSDAGTSFKTYIQSLVGSSDQAKAAMKKLGIQFFDAEGRMKPLGEQADVLRKALAGLTDQSKNEALKTIFGADAARTAIGLMNQGREGFEALQKTVAGGDVEAKIAKRMEGSVAAGNRIANAWEGVKIAIGDTGLLDALTAIKNAFAWVLEAIAHAPPALLAVGGAFAGLAAAIGPLLVVIGHVGAFLLARFAMGFGLVGRAIGLIVAPVSTAISMLGELGLARVLAVAGRAFLGLGGPIAWVVGAFLLFKDSVVPVLGAFWEKLTTTLGPPLEAIMTKVQDIFASISGGPIGTALAWLVDAFGVIKDVIGTAIAGQLTIVGEIIVRVLGVAVAAIGGFVEVVGAMVDTISALLSGDFAGAWEAVERAIEAVFGAIVDMAVALVPELEAPLRLCYAAAKAWLADGFASIGTWMSDAVSSAVNYVANAFPKVVAAAKGVYEGVKGWLVDKFGWLLDWISKAAKFIGDKYQALKEKLGLGAAVAVAEPKAPEAPKTGKVANTMPKRSVSFDDDPKAKKAAGGRKGRDATYDAANRAELQLQAELQAARERGDRETAQRIEDRLALEKQVEAYQRTGLTLDQARAAAQRDMAGIQAARAVAVAREIADERAEVAIDVAHLDQNVALEESLERQAELKKRIAFYYAQTRDLAEATKLAEADQKSVDEARARARERWFEDDAQDRAVRLAQMRGATDEEVRQLQRVVDIRERARELEKQGMSKGDAEARAASEWSDEERARMQGEFRTAVGDGVRAAMDGDLKNFAKNWWKDRIAKGMEEAINSLSDLLQKLFAGVKIGGEADGAGGIFGAIGKALGLATGGAKTGGYSDVDWGGTGGAFPFPTTPDFSKLPGFANGGSFKVGGMSGIDRNVVSMRLSRGEMVDITKPGNDNGGSGTSFYMPIDARGADPAAIARLEGALARFQAEFPGKTVQVVADAQQRGMLG